MKGALSRKMLSRVKPRSLSPEEEAELARSNKKVKESHSARSVEDEPPGFEKISSHPKLSFKEKLVGEIPGLSPRLSISLGRWNMIQSQTMMSRS